MDLGRPLLIVGIAGSLIKSSYNKMLLRAASELLLENARLEILDLDGLPLYNQDLEQDMPEVVRRFKDGIRRADALIIATPEYNSSIPACLRMPMIGPLDPMGIILSMASRSR